MKTKVLTRAAIIAALYVALTYVSNAFGLASGAIQLRLSEALTILPVFTISAIPGLTAGCLIANLLTGCVAFDVIFGTLATFLGAVFTRTIGKNNKYFAVIPPILSNTLIIPFVLKIAYGAKELLPYLFFTVGAGEILSCGVLGLMLHSFMIKHKNIFK